MNTLTGSGSLAAYQRHHTDRVQSELHQAGVTSYGRLKFVYRYLPKVIHDDEHVEAVVYGRYQDGPGWLNLSEGWLVATDYRVLFIDHKPGFTNIKELGYDIVAGVQQMNAWPTSSLTLNSKVGSFIILFANRHCVDRFMQAIESRRLSKAREGMFLRPSPQPDGAKTPPTHLPMMIGTKALRFLRTHNTAVLSTRSGDGENHNSVVYYLIDDRNIIYILTKGDTQKAVDILSYPHVIVVVYDAVTDQTVELHGSCEIETDQTKKDWVFQAMSTSNQRSDTWSTPLATTRLGGEFVILRIRPVVAHFADYLQSPARSPLGN